MTRAQIPQRVCGPLAFPVLLAISLLLALAPAPSATASPPASAATASQAPESTMGPATVATAGRATVATGTTVVAAASSSLTVALTSITPTIALPNATTIITGSVRNVGSLPITSPVAHVFIGQNPLTSRAGVTTWATSDDADELVSDVARTTLGKALKPGSITRFALTIPATAVSHRVSFAVLPLRIEVAGRTAISAKELGSLHTFLPALSSTKAYEPVSIAWLVPLTLDPDPALHGMDSPARTAAWNRAIGPGSRLDRLIRGTDGTNVTWAIDPAILGPPRTPVPERAPDAPGLARGAPRTPTPTGATTDQVTEATTALARRLRAAAPRHTLWSLPYADPDLSAILPRDPENSALAALVDRASTLQFAGRPARTDVAWPAEGNLPAESEARLKGVFDSAGLAAAVTSASSLTSLSSSTSNASRRSSSGLPLLAYDEALSVTAAQTSSTSTGALAIQRFLADSMALLGERPGTPDRSVLVAFPRTFAGDPAVLRSFFAAVAKAKWLVPTTTEQLLATSRELDPEVPGFGTSDSAALPTATRNAPDPLSPGRSRLTAAELASIPGTTSAITGIASIRDDARLFQSRWTDAQDQLLSTRWRDHPRGPAAIKAATTAAISTISRGVTVVPSSVNFFADRGVLQVTVVNALDIPIHDVHLTLTPAQPRLRIEQQPGPLKIGARSRANVRLEVTSIAAGLVRIEARLTTTNGTALGRNARVDVRVQPTSTWIYWVLGGLASVILILGIYRSLRRGSTRASRPAAQELPLHD